MQSIYIGPELRFQLAQVFYSPDTVEHVVARCRHLTRTEEFKGKEMFFRGLNSDSAGLKAHSLSLLESIARDQKRVLGVQQQHYTRWKKEAKLSHQMDKKEE
jgi:hypothetical protein